MKRTRCPECGTAFRVSDEQLEARAGMVRCGLCRAPFNALECLVPVPAEYASETPLPFAVSAPAPADEPERPQAGTQQEPATIPEAQHDEPEQAGPEPRVEPEAQGEPPEAVPTAEPVVAETPPDTPVGESPATDTHAETVPAEVAAKPEQSRAARIRLPLAAVGLLLALALVQGLQVFHDALAHTLPALRPAIEAFCSHAGCSIDLPREIELVSIEDSELRPDPARKDHLVFRATLRNSAAFAQQHPHLELTLTDARDRAVGRRVFGPKEYLRAEQLAEGFRALSEQNVQLVLTAPELGPSGYRIYAFYP